MRSCRNLGDAARDSGQSRVPAPPAGMTAQKCSPLESVVGSDMAGTLAHAPARHLPVTRHTPARRRPLTRAADAGSVRVAIVTESFLPSLNGVTTSVCRVAECLRAARSRRPGPRPAPGAGQLRRVPRARPSRRCRCGSSRSGCPTGEVEALLAGFAPDVVHVASPFVLGASALAAARPARPAHRRGLPDRHAQLPAPARARAPWAGARRARPGAGCAASTPRRPHPRALHGGAGRAARRTAYRAPRSGRAACDTDPFHPGWRADAGTRALRRSLAPRRRGARRLRRSARPREGAAPAHRPRRAPRRPARRRRRRARPGPRTARPSPRPASTRCSLGRREGDDLARAYAALDVFVHTGTRETFGQTLQEAAATGLPVVAPARGGPLDLVDHSRTGLLFDPRQRPRAARVPRPPRRRPGQARGHGRGRPRPGRPGRSWAALTDQLLGHYARRSAARARVAVSCPRRRREGPASGDRAVTGPVHFSQAGRARRRPRMQIA